MQKILSYLRRGIADYDMIQNGDKIAVGISGGKDSLVLLTALCRLKTFLPEKFELEAVTIDTGYTEMNFEPVKKLCDELKINYTVNETHIKEILELRGEKNPCSLCANLRRGALNNSAKALGCNKVALAHHNDDVIETFYMSLIFEGRLHCFSPVTYLDRKDVTVIRPLIYAPETLMSSTAKKLGLNIVKNACPMDNNSKRKYVKDMIYNLEKENKGFKTRLFTAVQSLENEGWKKI